MATPEDIIEAKRIASAKQMAAASNKTSLQKAEEALASLTNSIKTYMSDPVNAARVAVVESKTAANAYKTDTALSPAEKVRAAAEAAKKVSASERVLEEAKIAQGLGVDTTNLTPVQIKAATRTASNEAKTALLKGEKPPVPAEDDEYTYDYTWHVFAGGGGEWRLVRYPKYKPMSSGNGNNGNANNGNNGNGDGTGDGSTTKLTTNIDVLKSLLRGMGFGMSLVDSSADFLNRLLKDGLDYDNAIAIFLDSKEYTFKDGKKITSPFYTAYGYLNEGLTVPKSASELFNAVEGYKEIVSKYALSDKYLSSDSLKKYVKNNVSVSELDGRANAARLKAVNADKSYTDALQALGYIKSPTDLTDFFLNPDIGKEVLEQNRATAAFSAEAIRRAQQGIKFDATRFAQISAGLVGQGLNEAQIGATAATGFEQIGQQIAPMQKLVNVYDRQGLPESDVVDLQKELEAEQFLGTASQRRKRVTELETRAFQATAGTTTASLRGARAGII